MAELKLISPLLSNMEVVECVSVRGAAAVYIVRSTKSGQTYVLKHISVPESQKQVDALMFTEARISIASAAIRSRPRKTASATTCICLPSIARRSSITYPTTP